MARTGRRCKLEALHGSMNEPNINGSHPAMLAMQQCISDVQLPYLSPIGSVTHGDLCKTPDQCIPKGKDEQIIEAWQRSKDAHADCSCDYQCKRQPCGCNDIREACLGAPTSGRSHASRACVSCWEASHAQLCGKSEFKSFQTPS